jgi:hypothetical protein
MSMWMAVDDADYVSAQPAEAADNIADMAIKAVDSLIDSAPA